MSASEEQEARKAKFNGPQRKAKKTRGHGDNSQAKALGLEISQKEARFVSAMVRAIATADGKVDPVDAARLAKYAEPEVSAYDLLGRPAVQAALSARAVRHIFGRLLPAALVAHEEIIIDKSASPSARIQAIRAVYELSGIDGQTIHETTSNSGKSIAEMSRDELSDLVDKSREALHVLEGRAVDITPENQGDQRDDGTDPLTSD